MVAAMSAVTPGRARITPRSGLRLEGFGPPLSGSSYHIPGVTWGQSPEGGNPPGLSRPGQLPWIGRTRVSTRHSAGAGAVSATSVAPVAVYRAPSDRVPAAWPRCLTRQAARLL